jgi:hypothetical protein
MATTTPNFGWPVPTSTDYVKDGATAIEALGDAIDATVAGIGGGMTLLATSPLTGASVTVSSISQNYKHLLVLFKGVYTSASENITIRLNGDSGTNYNWVYTRVITSTVTGLASSGSTYYQCSTATGNSSTPINQLTNSAIWLYRYTDTDYQEISSASYGYQAGYSYHSATGVYDKNAAITSITYLPLTGNWSGGTAYLYGVS